MDFLLSEEDISRFDPLIEKFVQVKEKYGDEYPIILYEPDIELKEKEALKDAIQGNNSLHVFSKFQDALEFVQSLGISFILIISSNYEEQVVLKNFQDLANTHGREMFDFEEEAFLKDIFKEASEDLVKSFKVKAYLFITLLDSQTEIPVDGNEEEVMMMCDLKDMAKEFRQEFLIIWYDPDVNFETKKKLENDIEIIIEESNIYIDFGELYQRVKSYAGIPYFLILSRADKTEKIIKEIDSHKDLLGLYVYCGGGQKSSLAHDKVEIQETLDKLIPRIKEGFRTKSKLVNTFPAFARNFDALDKSHIFYIHYYLRGLINFENRKQAKGDFVKLARKVYQDQDKALDRFENGYESFNRQDILKWYTRDSPIYKLINNCLRLSSSDSILYCRFALKDMERAIREHYREESKDFNGVVYRGAYISKEEWEKLERNIGEEIEMYGFLSTTVSQRTALRFLTGDLENKIFITIIVPPLPELDEQGFADISKFSEFQAEQEILFNVRSRFKIVETRIDKIDNRGTRCRHLVLLYGAHLLRKHTTQKKPMIEIELKLPAKVECFLCKSKETLFGFNQAQNNAKVLCLGCLGKEGVPKDVPLLALDFEKNTDENRVIRKSFKGKIFQFHQAVSFPFYGYTCDDCQGPKKAKYYKWVTLDGDKINIQCNDCFQGPRKFESHILLAESNPYVVWQEEQPEWEVVDSGYQPEVSKQAESNNQGSVYLEVQEFDLCLKYQQRVVNQLKRKRWRERRRLESMSQMGEASQKLGLYQQAVDFFLKVFRIERAIYGEKSPMTAASCNNLAFSYQRLEEYQQAIEYHEKALNALKAIYGEKHSSTATSYRNLAEVYLSLGEYQQALEYHQKSLDIRKAVYGEKHPTTAISYSSLALVYQRLGRHQEALENNQKALDVKKAIYGEKHQSTATSYNNLAEVYRKLGKHQEALNYHTKALDTRKAIGGEKHPDTATSYDNLALVYYDLGEYHQALEYHQKALDIRKAVYGEKHPATAISYHNLALVYQSLEKHQEALEYHQKALNIRKVIVGEEHPETALSYNGLGGVYQSLGQHQQALEYTLKAMKIREKIYGEKHPDTATSYNNLATIYSKLGEHKQALEYSLKGVDIIKTIYGENHPKTAASYNNLATLYYGLGKHKQAFEYFLKGVDIIKSIYGELHPTTATLYNNLAFMYDNLGEYQLSLVYYKKALDTWKVIYGEKHPSTATSYTNLAEVYRSLGKHQEALNYHKKGLDIRKAIFGKNNPETVTLYNNLAELYQSLGEHQQALEHYQKALDINKAIYGESHPNTVTSYNSLASRYHSLGDHQQALEYFLRSLDICKTIYGEKHPNTAISYNNIGEAYNCLGRYKQALEYNKKALEASKAIYGEKHQTTMLFYLNLASVYHNMGEKQQGLECDNKALDIKKAIEREKQGKNYFEGNIQTPLAKNLSI